MDGLRLFSVFSWILKIQDGEIFTCRKEIQNEKTWLVKLFHCYHAPLALLCEKSELISHAAIFISSQVGQLTASNERKDSDRFVFTIARGDIHYVYYYVIY